LAVLASASRRGFWRLAPESRVVAVLGSCKLDLREARVSAPITNIEVFVLLGSVDVLVGPGVEVDIDSQVLLGSRDMGVAGNAPTPGGPTIRITGAVVLGSLNVRGSAALAAEGMRAWDAD
jgi:hypothetical protein